MYNLPRQIREAWSLDFVGQGLSLPGEDPTFLSSRDGNKNGFNRQSGGVWGFGDESKDWAKGLVFSIDLWRDQVRCFVQEVIKEPVYIVGNSLGGYVALYFAACNPELVKGVTLLNATPFWGFLPNPVRSPRLSRLFLWTGTFPLPSGVKKLTEVLWQKISDPRSIAEILKQVYADHSTRVDEVFSRIIETTRHPAAAASFASIIFAPQGQLSFDETLTRCKTNKTPVCLMYGKEDPWVRPVWGFQVKRKVPEAPYYEISPAGHCPHDEVPEMHWYRRTRDRRRIRVIPVGRTRVLQITFRCVAAMRDFFGVISSASLEVVVVAKQEGEHDGTGRESSLCNSLKYYVAVFDSVDVGLLSGSAARLRVDGGDVGGRVSESGGRILHMAIVDIRSTEVPGPAMMIVGQRKDSQNYVNMKRKASAEVAINSIDFQGNRQGCCSRSKRFRSLRIQELLDFKCEYPKAEKARYIIYSF
ncbi:Pheophytinase- chloroplastic [Striga hermonthica]|uniref:Pheophytinase- chloroplastic n=1 Tax=Striga hermonthica TaxID=68872 RepID=A0A9N7NB31_STRHE|nr:Pheophytinase- chloroplastic [Striga hermonthica]